MNRTGPEAVYSVHPSVPYAQAILRKLPEKTGRSVEEWIALLDRDGPPGAHARRDWLKEEHGLGGTTGRMVADASVGEGEDGTDPDAYLKAAPRYVDTMFDGKETLRPIYDRLLELGRSLGSGVRVCPCKTIVPLYRSHVFAEIKPTTKTRVDLGLALKGVDREMPERIIDTGGLARKDRITHRIAITALDEIDDEVREWLRVAYELDG
jgi:hypothetical protein